MTTIQLDGRTGVTVRAANLRITYAARPASAKARIDAVDARGSAVRTRRTSDRELLVERPESEIVLRAVSSDGTSFPAGMSIGLALIVDGQDDPDVVQARRSTSPGSWAGAGARSRAPRHAGHTVEPGRRPRASRP